MRFVQWIYVCCRDDVIDPSLLDTAFESEISLPRCHRRCREGSDHNSRIRIHKPPAREAGAHMSCCDRPLLPRIRLVVPLIVP